MGKRKRHGKRRGETEKEVGGGGDLGSGLNVGNLKIERAERPPVGDAALAQALLQELPSEQATPSPAWLELLGRATPWTCPPVWESISLCTVCIAHS